MRGLGGGPQLSAGGGGAADDGPSCWARAAEASVTSGRGSSHVQPAYGSLQRPTLSFSGVLSRVWSSWLRLLHPVNNLRRADGALLATLQTLVFV